MNEDARRGERADKAQQDEQKEEEKTISYKRTPTSYHCECPPPCFPIGSIDADEKVCHIYIEKDGRR